MTHRLETYAPIALAVLSLLALALIPARAKSDDEIILPSTSTTTALVATLAPPAPTDLEKRQEKWIDALRACESSGNDSAVNVVDRDGTSSYGRFQFKPGTFYGFSKHYGLPLDTSYLDGEQQEDIVRHMINDPAMTDHELKYRQFPDCIQNHVGLPPRK